LHVEAPGEVTEGGTAVLTCNTTCSLTDPTFFWYKNGRPLTTKIIKNNQLHLQPVSSEDAGSYSCAVKGYPHLNSTAQNFRVRYSPKNVAVSISGKIVEGSSVNLTCSSDANPPVKNYTWFKDNGASPVGFGHRNKRRVKKKEDIMVNTVYAEIWGVPANDDAVPNSSESSDAVYANVVQPNLYETIQAESSPVKTSVCMAAVEEDVKEKSLEADVLYSTIRFPNASMANRLSDVMKKDERLYGFRIIADVEGQRWVGKPGVRLRVTDLQVEAPGEVTEGETAVLTCRTTCSLTDPTFIWYKNGRPLTTKTIKNNQLHLQPVSSEDAGSYSCAVGGYDHLRSTDLNMRQPSKKVSMSISGYIVEGSSVNLTCSSDANPPLNLYTLFKEGGTSPVGTGHIINITAEDIGLYYSGAQNGTVSTKGPPQDHHRAGMMWVVDHSQHCSDTDVVV
ncbi:hypothetical protein NFI96_008249, partial [Prochilodus magdalenae]